MTKADRRVSMGSRAGMALTEIPNPLKYNAFSRIAGGHPLRQYPCLLLYLPRVRTAADAGTGRGSPTLPPACLRVSDNGIELTGMAILPCSPETGVD